MVKQREGYKIIMNKEAQERIDNSQCPSCGKPKEQWDRRTDWRCCSSKCSSKFYENYISYGWPQFRFKVLERDNFTCVKCGERPELKVILYEKNLEDYYKTYYYRFRITKNEEEVKYGYSIGKRGIVAYVEDSRKLVADHIKPIALGGDEWEMDNIQTLCLKCNKVKTAQDIKDIALLRRKEKLKKQGQETLKALIG